MSTAVKVCVAIAVYKPEKLDPLPGALTAAHTIVEWASALGYRALLITDDTEPVTCERLRNEIEPLISDVNEERDRIVIAFAGHGMSTDVRDLWLLSHWRTGPEEVVDVQRLRSRLATYQPAQITIISDACRTGLPNDDFDLQGSRILSRKDWGTDIPDEDILRATKLGAPAYMVRGLDGGKPHCLFTHVVTNALWGRYPESVDATRAEGPVVTSQTLKIAVRKHLPLSANDLDRSQVPDITTNFTPPKDVYTPLTGLTAPAAVTLSPVQLTTPPPPAPAERRLGGGRPFKGRVIPEFKTTLPPQRSPARRQPGTPEQRARLIRAQLREEAALRPTHFETGTGLAVIGDQIAEVAVHPSAQALPDLSPIAPPASQGHWFALHGPPGPLAVRLASGHWVCAALYPRMIGTFTIQAQGASAVVYRPSNDANPGVAEAAEAAVAALRTGLLDDREALSLAAQIRDYKHVDPMLGVISAYLYARVADLQRIRQIAAYYCFAGQPIPYDVALLGRLPMRWDGHCLRATVPATSARAAQTKAEEERAFTTKATPETEGVVAGSFPWLRQGWSLLEDFAPPGAPALMRVEAGLTEALFTTLDAVGGRALANLIHSGEI